MRELLLAAVLLTSTAALARQPALHDIAWYSAHDRERQVTMQMCHNNQSLQLASDDCANAERAQATVPFRSSREPLAYLDDPAYYSANPVFRQAVLNVCQHPEKPGSQIYIPHCAAARASAAASRGR